MLSSLFGLTILKITLLDKGWTITVVVVFFSILIVFV